VLLYRLDTAQPASPGEGPHVKMPVKRDGTTYTKRWRRRVVMKPARRHVNWDFAERVLAEVLPGSTAYDHDKIQGIPPLDWQPFDIEYRDMTEVEDDFLMRCSELSGPLVVVNDTSFDPDQGPYFTDASELTNFVRNFGDRVRDYFMIPSLFVISPTTGRVLIVQDDGYFVEVQGRPVWGGISRL
jgi:hypothetical protein